MIKSDNTDKQKFLEHLNTATMDDSITKEKKEIVGKYINTII